MQGLFYTDWAKKALLKRLKGESILFMMISWYLLPILQYLLILACGQHL